MNDESVYDLLRLYDPDDVGTDGYPAPWHHSSFVGDWRWAGIKYVVREMEGHRCERCRHPYRKGDERISPGGQWSPCDEMCRHGGAVRIVGHEDSFVASQKPERIERVIAAAGPGAVEAQWRILTVHHLNGVKYDCRWWNLAALCQRCHLTIQAKVHMERDYERAHSDWFRIHAAGWYAAKYLGQELTREEATARLDELLALEQTMEPLDGVADAAQIY